MTRHDAYKNEKKMVEGNCSEATQLQALDDDDRELRRKGRWRRSNAVDEPSRAIFRRQIR